MTQVQWRQRAQFFAMAAQMMRRILVDAARARKAHKRGGQAARIDLDEAAMLPNATDRSIVDLDEALTSSRKSLPGRRKWSNCAISAGWKSRDRRRAGHLAAHGETRLGSGQSLAPA